MGSASPLVSKGTLFWRGAHPAVEAARRLPGWRQFHRRLGEHGLNFEDIESAGRNKFVATTARLERRRGYFLRFRVSEGSAATVVGAMTDALAKAAEAGFSVPADLVDLLAEAPEIRVLPVPAVPDEIAAMLGDVAASIEEMLG